MRTKQPRQPFIDSLDRTFARYGRPDQLINVLNCLNVRSDDTHSRFRLAETALVLANLTNHDIYNTVILGIDREEAAAYLMAAHVRKECDYGRHEQLRNWAAEAMSIVADRTHWQILRLCGSSEFQADCRWIANELSVRVDEVNLALSRLLRLRLLEMSGGGVWRDLSRSSQMTEREFRRLALGRVREMAAALERQP